MPIRILQIIRTMNIGGAETFLMNIYRKLDKSKIQFDFLVNAEGTFDNEIKEMGGKIYYMPYLTQIGPFAYCKKLKKFFSEHQEYTIVHSHIDQVSGLILQCAKKCNIQVRISHSHSSKNSNGYLGKIYKKYLQRKILRNATHYFACSDKAAKWLFKNKSKKAIIINNCIDTEKFRFDTNKREEIRKKLNLSNDNYVLLHVGRFVLPKNHLFLLEIFNEIIKKKPKSILLLAGDGIERNKIEKRIREMNLQDSVILLGEIENINDIMQAADVFIFPSIYEGLPLTLIEAQASGLPIYASSNITKICNICEKIQYIDLNKGPEYWANKILNNDNKRYDIIEKIKEKGFDANDFAKKLSNMYSEFNKKRILHIVGCMDCGGQETFIMNMYRKIDKTKYQFDFIVNKEEKGFYDDEIERLGGKIYRIPGLSKNFFKHCKKIKKIIQDGNYTTVYRHTASSIILPELIVARICKVKNIIVHSHNTSASNKKIHYILRNFLKSKRYKKVACSKEAAKWLFNTEKDVLIIPNAIETEKFRFNEENRERIRKELKIENKFVIGHVGRFNIQKNHEKIIDIFNEIAKQKQDSVLLLIGSGELENKIKNKVQNLKLQDKVLFLGLRKDVNELYSAMDILIFPSLYEGLPVSIVEAQCSGLPCYISNIITNEVKLTDLITEISLSDNIEENVKTIFSGIKNYQRELYEEKISNSVFNVDIAIKKLEEIL